MLTRTRNRDYHFIVRNGIDAEFDGDGRRRGAKTKSFKETIRIGEYLIMLQDLSKPGR